MLSTPILCLNASFRNIRVIIDPEARWQVLTQLHDKCNRKEIEALKCHMEHWFYWPRMYADIVHHVKSCHECQVHSTKRFHQPITVSVPIRVFEKIYLDIMRMPEDKYHKRYIIVAKDDLSGVTEARALASGIAQEVSNFLWEQIYCQYGAPEVIVTDNGSEFKAAFMDLTEQLHILQVTISPYSSQANGVVERGHFIL